MTSAQLLLQTFNEARSITNYYFNKIKDTDIQHTVVADGIPLNSAQWIMAHVTWAEHFLILEGLGGMKMPLPWFSKVSFGAPMAKPEELPAIEEILSAMKAVHEAVNAFVPGLSDKFLEEKNELGLKFGPNESKRYILMHAIRHEGNHAGQLGWLCKIHLSKINA